MAIDFGDGKYLKAVVQAVRTGFVLDLPVKYSIILDKALRFPLPRQYLFSREKVLETSGGVTLYFSYSFYGSLGHLEIFETLDGGTRIKYSGIDPSIRGDESRDDLIAEKKSIGWDLVENFLSELDEIGIDLSQFVGEDVQPVKNQESTKDPVQAPFPLPWENMEGASERDINLIKDWCTTDTPGRLLAQKYFIRGETFYNYKHDLVERYPDAGIPLGQAGRSKFLREWDKKRD